MKRIYSSITAPKGYKALGIHCGIKKEKEDLGIIYSEHPALCVAFFTTNALTSAHIQFDKMHLRNSPYVRAIVVNSANANCCTGRQGLHDCFSMARDTAKVFKIKPEQVLVASTGIIGKRLPIKEIKKAILKFPVLISKKGGKSFAHSILTTDTRTKEIAVAIKLKKGKIVKIAGVAKGAGMINPFLATTLMFITTDAAISKVALKKASRLAIDNSLNIITVDGDRSPNDSFFILANSLAQNETIKPKGVDFEKFRNALVFVCNKLAKLLIKDAEGATKFIAINVKRANSKKQAQIVASAIANSLLFKTMIYGSDPNWGRIVASAGSADKNLNIKMLDVYIGCKKVFSNGVPCNINRNILRKILLKKEIDITLDLKSGIYQAFKYTCDLSPGYVRINSKYST
jgi:glutamate N-acetyltransferase/amino-acid N-acetyltransferase